MTSDGQFSKPLRRNDGLFCVTDEFSMTDCFLLPKDQYNRYADHLKRLTGDDRTMRFWSPIGDKSIDHHIEELPEQSVVFVITENDLVVGAIEIIPAVGRGGLVDAEFGISVEATHRRTGLAHVLLASASDWAMKSQAVDLFCICLSRNKPMIELARSHGMIVAFDGREAEAHLAIVAA